MKIIWVLSIILSLICGCTLSTDVDTDRRVTLIDSLDQSNVKSNPVIVTPTATFYEKGTSSMIVIRDTIIQDSGINTRIQDTTIVVQDFNSFWAFRTSFVRAAIDTSTSPMTLTLDLQLIDDSNSRSLAKIIRPEYVVSMQLRLDSIPAVGSFAASNSPRITNSSQVTTTSSYGLIQHDGVLKVFFGKTSRTNDGKNGEIQLIISANIPTQDKQFQVVEFGGLITMKW